MLNHPGIVNTVLDIETIALTFIKQCDVDLLDKIYDKDNDTRLRVAVAFGNVDVKPVLDMPHFVSELSKHWDLDEYKTFPEFIRAYNQKYLLVRSHPDDYTRKYLNQVPLDERLRRVAKTFDKDMVESVLDDESIWMSRHHITIMCKEWMKDEHNWMVEEYTSEFGENEQYIHMDLNAEAARRGVGFYVDDFNEFNGIVNIALGNGRFDLVLENYEDRHDYVCDGDVMPIVKCMISECRYDLLQVNNGVISVKDGLVPSNYPIESGTVDANEAANWIDPQIITEISYREFEKMGMNITYDLFQHMEYDRSIEYLPVMKLLKDQSRVDGICGVIIKHEKGEEIGDDELYYAVREGSSFENFMWIKEHIPERVNDKLAEVCFAGIIRGSYQPYELRKMVEMYPDWSELYEDEIRNVIDKNEDIWMDTWLEELINSASSDDSVDDDLYEVVKRVSSQEDAASIARTPDNHFHDVRIAECLFLVKRRDLLRLFELLGPRPESPDKNEIDTILRTRAQHLLANRMLYISPFGKNNIMYPIYPNGSFSRIM